MPRNYLKRISARYRQNHADQPRIARFFARVLEHPAYLAVNRRSVAGAIGAGLAASVLPMPGQSAVALLVGIVARVNVAVAMLMVWVTNPVTAGPVLYAEYRLGTLLLGVPPEGLPGEWSLEAIAASLAAIWKPLLLGSGVTAMLVGVVGYVVTDWLWRWSVAFRYRRRQRQRRLPDA